MYQPIEVPGEELIPGHTYYIANKDIVPNQIPGKGFPIYPPKIGCYVCRPLPNEYMFNKVYGCAVQFYKSSRYTFYTCIAYRMKDHYKQIRTPLTGKSLREELMDVIRKIDPEHLDSEKST